MQRKLSKSIDVWGDSFEKVGEGNLSAHTFFHDRLIRSLLQIKDELRNGLSVCSNWLKITESLTKTFWKSHARHPWTLEPHQDKQILLLEKRIDHVLTVRALHEQLLRLLTADEQVGVLFALFNFSFACFLISFFLSFCAFFFPLPFFIFFLANFFFYYLLYSKS